MRKNKWKLIEVVPRAAESASKDSVAATPTTESTNTAHGATTAAADTGIIAHYGEYRNK